MSTNFALIGAGGYVAPRHIKAIHESGCKLVAAVDPFTSVGALDRYSVDVQFFTEIEYFDKYLEESQKGGENERIQWVSVCSPNYLHDAHIRMSLRSGANVLCEKPLVVDPRDLDLLQEAEIRYGRRAYTVLQLRLHPKLIELKQKIMNAPQAGHYDVVLTYITSRGPWYDKTWKGCEEKSGGVCTNIGIHLLDLLVWLFGSVISYDVHLQQKHKVAGILRLEKARVRWFLSTDFKDLSYVENPELQFAHREILINGVGFGFSDSFADLHTCVYKNTLEGAGFDIDSARPSVELAYKLRLSCEAKPHIRESHPLLLKGVH